MYGSMRLIDCSTTGSRSALIQRDGTGLLLYIIYRLFATRDISPLTGSVVRYGHTLAGGAVPTSGEVNLWRSTSQIYPDADTYKHPVSETDINPTRISLIR